MKLVKWVLLPLSRSLDLIEWPGVCGTVVLSFIRSIWLERNGRVFDERKLTAMLLVEKAKFLSLGADKALRDSLLFNTTKLEKCYRLIAH